MHILFCLYWIQTCMYQIQTCLYEVCMCMYFFAHTYKISQLLCCLYVLKDTYKYKHAGSLMSSPSPTPSPSPPPSPLLPSPGRRERRGRHGRRGLSLRVPLSPPIAHPHPLLLQSFRPGGPANEHRFPVAYDLLLDSRRVLESR
jgi:hypothetical protein